MKRRCLLSGGEPIPLQLVTLGRLGLVAQLRTRPYNNPGWLQLCWIVRLHSQSCTIPPFSWSVGALTSRHLPTSTF